MQILNQDKEFLLEAIDNYALLPHSGRVLLKTLITLSIDELIVTNIKELSRLAGISRPAVYANLRRLEIQGMVERRNNDGSRISSFILKPMNFYPIIKHYEVRKDILSLNKKS